MFWDINIYLELIVLGLNFVPSPTPKDSRKSKSSCGGSSIKGLKKEKKIGWWFGDQRWWRQRWLQCWDEEYNRFE